MKFFVDGIGISSIQCEHKGFMAYSNVKKVVFL